MTDRAARVPRGTCRIFGAIKAGGTIQNCLILVHGPRGCVYHINYILGMRGDRPSEVYTTALDEHDVIFGSEDRLREAIEYLDRALCPELIFVLSCCASEIIGEDVGGMAVHVAARVAALAQAGEVLASGTTYGTVVGSGLSFEYRGGHPLKGVADHWPIFALID